jgi:hypothetical protein
LIPKFSRRSVLAGAAATTAQLLFRTKLSAAAALSTEESQQLAAAPGLVDLVLTALTPNTLRIGIAPATAQAPPHELGFVDREWPAPLENRDEVLNVTKTFREKKLPCDAVIYLGTGFCPSGWNTGHASFAFNDHHARYGGRMPLPRTVRVELVAAT